MDAAFSHAQLRCAERAGIEYSEIDLGWLAEVIRAGLSRAVVRSSIRRAIHEIDVGSHTHRVVYSRTSGSIVTFLDGLPVERSAPLTHKLTTHLLAWRAQCRPS